MPAVLGAATPKGNNAEMKTKGWELSVMWRDNFTLANKPFNYSVKAMLWDSRTWVTKFNNPTNYSPLIMRDRKSVLSGDIISKDYLKIRLK